MHFDTFLDDESKVLAAGEVSAEDSLIAKDTKDFEFFFKLNRSLNSKAQ